MRVRIVHEHHLYCKCVLSEASRSALVGSASAVHLYVDGGSRLSGLSWGTDDRDERAAEARLSRPARLQRVRREPLRLLRGDQTLYVSPPALCSSLTTLRLRSRELPAVPTDLCKSTCICMSYEYKLNSRELNSESSIALHSSVFCLHHSWQVDDGVQVVTPSAAARVSSWISRVARWNLLSDAERDASPKDPPLARHLRTLCSFVYLRLLSEEACSLTTNLYASRVRSLRRAPRAATYSSWGCPALRTAATARCTASSSTPAASRPAAAAPADLLACWMAARAATPPPRPRPVLLSAEHTLKRTVWVCRVSSAHSLTRSLCSQVAACCFSRQSTPLSKLPSLLLLFFLCTQLCSVLSVHVTFWCITYVVEPTPSTLYSARLSN